MSKAKQFFFFAWACVLLAGFIYVAMYMTADGNQSKDAEATQTQKTRVQDDLEQKDENLPILRLINDTEANQHKGAVHEVTAYNVGDVNQCDDDPCIGASGDNLCEMLKQGAKICASNKYALRTRLHIEGIGECIVLDRMNKRFANRIDIAMNPWENTRALAFGLQLLQVKVLE